jgi:hypothetical protein
MPFTRYVMGAAIIELPKAIVARRSPDSAEYALRLPLASPWNTRSPAVASTPPSQLVAVCISQTTRCCATFHARKKPRDACWFSVPRASWVIGGSSPYNERIDFWSHTPGQMPGRELPLNQSRP